MWLGGRAPLGRLAADGPVAGAVLAHQRDGDHGLGLVRVVDRVAARRLRGISHVESMNWKAPRYLPPPPIAWGSPPDSHCAVCLAQCLSCAATLSHRRTYFEASAGGASGVSPPIVIPPDPDEASAGATEQMQADGERDQRSAEGQGDPGRGAHGAVRHVRLRLHALSAAFGVS